MQVLVTGHRSFGLLKARTDELRMDIGYQARLRFNKCSVRLSLHLCRTVIGCGNSLPIFLPLRLKQSPEVHTGRFTSLTTTYARG